MSAPLIYPGVTWEGSHDLGAFCVIGEAPRGKKHGELATRFGHGAVLRSHTVVYAGNVIGSGFQTGHGVLIREENEIGDDVSVGSHSIIEHHVKIASGVRIHSDAFIPEFSVLEEGCWIGPCVVMTNAKYPRGAGVKDSLQGPLIKAGAKVGANVTLLPGVVIGKNAVVGAGSVVVKSVADGAVVVGNPARAVKKAGDIPAYKGS